MNTCYNIDNRIFHICNCKYKYFFNKRNVVGVGLGYKITNGFNTSEKCIKIFVEKKLPIYTLNSNDIIPTLYNDIQTDIVETGAIYSSMFTERIRPFIGGYSIGISKADFLGSVGCLVTDGHDYYVLSNNHVLACENTAPIGATVIQPAYEDKGKASFDSVGKLSKFIPLQFSSFISSPENFVDCAIGKLVRKSILKPEIALLGKIKGIHPPILEEHVEKAGRTTELTLGQISSIGATIKVNYIHGKCVFKNQILTTKMSDYGDSGSILMDSKNYAIGLLFGGSTTSSFFNPINTVLQMLGVTIVS